MTPASVMLAEPPPVWLPEWADFAAGFDFARAGPALDAQTRLVLLDCIGAIAAGMQEPENLALARRLSRLPGAGQGRGIAVGAGLRLHAGDAAFANGTAGTALELDEGNSFARGHPGIHVLPALLSGAGGSALTGHGFLRAFALGYEACARVGASARLRDGLHPHGTWGVIGAAVAAGAAEGATAAEFAGCFNIAASMGVASSQRSMLEGATVRNAYAGLAARNGLYAWDLVRAGFAGEIDGVRTVYSSVLASGFDAAVMTRDLGWQWEIRRNYFKRHAACRFVHGALDVVAGLIRDHGCPDPALIAAVEVESYAMAAQLDAPEPVTMLGAKFSVPFAIATMLVHGEASVAAFRAPALRDERIVRLSRLVKVAENPDYTAMLPGKRPARVIIRLVDGRVLSGETLTNRGDAADPYSPQEVADKFMALAGPVWGTAGARRVRDVIERLGDGETPDSLCVALSAPPVPDR